MAKTTRRERVRAATMREIIQTARRILAEEGPEAVTLRAIAREMGMTAPALYRYFGSHEELVRHLVGDVFNDLTDGVHAALEAAPPGDMSEKFIAASSEFRRWALAHKREYALLFGVPVPGLEVEHGDFAQEGGRRFARTFLALFLELWRKKPFDVPADEEIVPALREPLQRYREYLDAPELPIGVMVRFLGCWIQLQGFVSLEVFGHLHFAFDDARPMFDQLMAEMMPSLGLDHPFRTP
ncbi:MAG TPA: TetR/AcrR family transcriptional regulator [Streptosporangiaceae bacterium]